MAPSPFINNIKSLTVSPENYLQNTPGGEVPGVLGLHQATASNIVNALIIGSYITPVPAAVIADSWLGRYKTMIYSAMYCSTLIFSYPLTLSTRWTANILVVLSLSAQQFCLRPPYPLLLIQEHLCLGSSLPVYYWLLDRGDSKPAWYHLSVSLHLTF